jgi:hypothetical protein
MIGNKEIPDVNVLRALAARSFPILLQNNCALVVLEQNILFDTISLRLHKIPSPTNGWHEVVRAYDLGLHKTPSVELLFSGTHNWKSMSY